MEHARAILSFSAIFGDWLLSRQRRASASHRSAPFQSARRPPRNAYLPCQRRGSNIQIIAVSIAHLSHNLSHKRAIRVAAAQRAAT